MKTLGKKLKTLRLAKEWTQEDIAYELDISLSAYSKIERGVTDINYSRLEQIAKLYKMTLVELISNGSKDASDIEKYKKQLEEKDKEILILHKEINHLNKELRNAMKKQK